MSLHDKILTFAQLPAWRADLRSRHQRLVVTNGCFDLLHAGHAIYLEAARRFGDALLVGLNGDESVRQLKGPSRPVNPAPDRALVLAALESVTAVVIFAEARATAFLKAAQPDIYVKGGDYTLDQLDREEKATVEAGGGRVELVPFLPGKSTTHILEKAGMATPNRIGHSSGPLGNQTGDSFSSGH